FEQIEDMYAAANAILGNIVKVTPSSKVVGDLALHLVAVGATPEQFEAEPRKFDVPDSVVGFLFGELGDPPGGWLEPFRTKALEGRQPKRRVQDLAEADVAGLATDRRATLDRLLFPGPTAEYLDVRGQYGDLSVLPTQAFFYGLEPEQEQEVEIEEGKTLILGLEAVSDADERGLRTVMCTLNGQLRPVTARDQSISSTAASAERVERGNPNQVGAPYDGVVTPAVAVGDSVAAGDVVATIEAMKMEASITAPHDGTVERLVVDQSRQCEGGDLVLVLSPAPATT
ncbi:MAG TPA: biotin/lipoyl-containing protein, partial [Nocardioidaceae bacterium]|nr:biotin/lipoyl-containing protein [Nocardioidaceae bacterium]